LGNKEGLSTQFKAVYQERLLEINLLHNTFYLKQAASTHDRLCGLVAGAPGYRSRGPGSIPRLYQIFWDVVDLKRGPLNLVSAIEELLGRNSSRFGLGSREYGSGDPLRWPRDTFLPQKLVLLTLPTSVGHSVVIFRFRTKATEFLVPFFFSSTHV
jgi:hypothetical protein